jgi:uncharacterized membrane protein (UPF0127 family)
MNTRLLAVLAGLSLACAACPAEGPARKADTNADVSTEDRQDNKERRLKAERARVEDQAERTVGDPCAKDSGCALYLRCIDQKCEVPPAVDGAEVPPGTPVASIAADLGEAQFHLETATTELERRRGLMWRPRMNDRWGMLFVYPSERPLSFWMRNTLIPLDMIFIDNAGQVTGVVANAEPRTDTSRSAGGPARYVLEINAGLAATYGIEAGNHVTFVGLTE